MLYERTRLPIPADKPPGGPGWLHEVKHDDFRLMAHRDAALVRLLTRNGCEWTLRFPLISNAVEALRVHQAGGSCFEQRVLA